MGNLSPRPGRSPSGRRKAESRAFTLVMVGGAAGAVAVVGLILAIVGVWQRGPAADRPRGRRGVPDAVPEHRRAVTRRAAAIAASAVALALAAPAVAQGSYQGAVDSSAQSATLTGIGDVKLMTGGGVLRHAELGPGYAGGSDFDSAQPGTQTVPDTGGWTLTLTGGGHDSLALQEGDTASPLSFAFGHTAFPDGVPCVVRDPNDRHGAIAFSLHPQQETRVCYRSGFDDVSVSAGPGATDFGVLDTEPGVPLRLIGSSGDDTMTEAANIPSGVGTPHNPASDVSFSGGPGNDQVTFDEGTAGTGAATYDVGNGKIRRNGLPPLSFDSTVEQLALYPHDGPTTITVGPTAGASLSVFGGFFGQKGPDSIDASRADASLFATGSTGDDTIVGGVLQDFIDGGGGNDNIDSRDASFDQVFCHGGSGTVKADTLDMVNDCPTAALSPPLIALSHASLTPKKVKRDKRVTFRAISTVAGRVTLTFKRRKARTQMKKLTFKVGPNAVKFKPPGGLVRGRYSVTAIVSGRGKKSKPVKLSLTLR